jgi:protein-disulfide isomerase/uncharacterized membrane protein
MSGCKLETTESGIVSVLLVLAAAAGLGLSIVSQLKICSACSETGAFSIFGMDFGWFGIGYFTVLLVSTAVRNRFTAADLLALVLISAAAGAEAHFIWVQKYVIGQWCPVCLGIAATVFAAAVVIFCETFPRFRNNGGNVKPFIKRFTLMALFSFTGLTVASLGVTSKSANAAGNPYLGKVDSTTVVYFVSDWFCPACRRLEPSLERIVPEIAKTVKVGFVDYPVHKETLNFTPYSLQFLYYEKDKYLSLRKALSVLSHKTKNPTAGEVQAAVAPLGVKLREVNYAEILAGMQADQAVYRGFGLKATPSVVVMDLRTRKTKIIVGDDAITLQAIKAAIAAVK